ncbi:MAG: hypothetical protein EON58_10355 [Alphaproteobacteria bacterium]|nr:MAG: hypothetical protein EON58_10355 [Alphaproteobacteria bacterium]
MANINEYPGWIEDPNSPVFDAFASRVLPLVGYMRPKFSVLLGANGAAELANQRFILRDAALGTAGINLIDLDYTLIVPGSVQYLSYAAEAKRVVTLTATALDTNGSNQVQAASLRTYRFSGRDIDNSAMRNYAGFGSTIALRATDVFNQAANDPSWVVTNPSSGTLVFTERVAGSFAQITGLLGFTAVVTTVGSPEMNSGKIAKAMGVPGASALADTDQLSAITFKYRLPTTITNYGFQEQGTPGNTAFGFEEVYVLIYGNSAGATPLGNAKTILQGQSTAKEYYAKVATPVPVPVPTP